MNIKKSRTQKLNLTLALIHSKHTLQHILVDKRNTISHLGCNENKWANFNSILAHKRIFLRLQLLDLFKNWPSANKITCTFKCCMWNIVILLPNPIIVTAPSLSCSSLIHFQILKYFSFSLFLKASRWVFLQLTEEESFWVTSAYGIY